MTSVAAHISRDLHVQSPVPWLQPYVLQTFSAVPIHWIRDILSNEKLVLSFFFSFSVTARENDGDTFQFMTFLRKRTRAAKLEVTITNKSVFGTMANTRENG